MSQQRANQLVEAGVWLRLSGDHDGARRLFEQALKMDPANDRAKQLLASDPLAQPARAPPGEVTPPGLAPAIPSVPPTVRPVPTPIPLVAEVAPPPVRPPPAQPYESPDGGWTLETDWSHALGGEQGGAPKPLAPDAQSAWDSQSNPGFRMPAAPTAGDAMDLIANDPPPPGYTPTPSPQPPLLPEELLAARNDEVETLLKGATDLIDLDDHSGAMDLITKAAQLAPDDARVKRMRERSEATLQAMFESKLGSLEQRPVVVLKDDEIIWLNLDHRAGFVLAQIDGTVSFADIFEVSGMSRLDTARILAQLMEEGVVRAR